MGEWTLSIASWGKLEGINKNEVSSSLVKTNYSLENIVEDKTVQEIKNIIFDSCIFGLKSW